MRRRLHQHAAIAVASLALAGCVQATRHSNTMLFGTSTQFGIRAGSGATSVPEINVGYSRQEAVVMPLVANSHDDGKVQTPCDPSATAAGPFRVHPCLLVGVYDKAQDSYSVLASFGAQFDGSVQVNGTSVKGGLAQYFATGVAAQMLAITGGASVVAIGDAAKASAQNTDETAAAVVALYGGDPELLEQSRIYRASYRDFRQRLIDRVLSTDPTILASRIETFEKETGTAGQALPGCKSTPSACAAEIRENNAYDGAYGDNPDKLETELKKWNPKKD